MNNPGNLDEDLFFYDEYCHSSMSRRSFLARATASGAASGVAGLAVRKAND